MELGQGLAVASGDCLHAHTPRIAVHEGTLNEEHVYGKVVTLVLTQFLQRSAPVIVYFLDMFTPQVLKWC